MATADNVEILQERLQELQAILRQNDRRLQSKFKLTPALSNILGLLMSQDVVQVETIEQMGLATPARHGIFRLRKSLKPWGIEIKSHHCVGYWLEPDTKYHVNKMITPGGNDVRL